MAVTAGEPAGPDASPLGQAGAGVRFEWGLAGARAVTPAGGILVVVDVLSFSTATAVAVGKGTTVYPHRWPDPDVESFAAAHRAVRAARRHEVTAEHPWSLSPSHLLAAPATARLVLPSPNGSTIAAAMEAEGAGVVVVAGCLRNASAVARWLRAEGFGRPSRPVAVVAAGERWPGGELRPALEDLLGAGAIIEALSHENAAHENAAHENAARENAARENASPEAEAAAAAWRAQRHHLADALARSSTGRHLAAAGYAGDVEVAGEHDTQDTVPVLLDGAFRGTFGSWT